MIKAVFFDRDNTIIKDVPYNGDPDKVELLPNAREAMEMLQNKGLCLFLITNQSGVGRGMITKEQVKAVNNEMIRQLGKSYFKDIYICYDDPDKPVTDCRKPSPKMLLEARDDHNINLTHSFLVGDKLEDIQAGHNAGCKSVLFLYGSDSMNQKKAKLDADFTATNLLEIANWICNNTTLDK